MASYFFPVCSFLPFARCDVWFISSHYIITQNSLLSSLFVSYAHAFAFASTVRLSAFGLLSLGSNYFCSYFHYSHFILHRPLSPQTASTYNNHIIPVSQGRINRSNFIQLQDELWTCDGFFIRQYLHDLIAHYYCYHC